MELRPATVTGSVTLKTLLPDCQIFGADDFLLKSCSHDWNQVQPGDLYVARVGIEKDGHDHIAMAIRKGAAAILCERFVVADVPVCLVDDTREAYGRICQHLAGNPAERLKLIGVTGTDGKTITGILIRAIFRQAGIRTGLVSTQGFCDGVVTSPEPETTPSPPRLAECLQEWVANRCQVGIIETSSVALAERRVSGLSFDAVVLTNLRKDHLDIHGTVENYRRIKTRMVERLKPGGFAVVNSDDRFLHRWVDSVDCPALTYGMLNYAEVTAEVIERTPFGQTFLLNAGTETIPVQTPVIGDFFVRHCLAAATTGLTLGLRLEEIAQGIESVRSVPGRMERLESGRGFSVFLDACQTPGQLCAMLKTLARNNLGGTIRCVFGGAERLTREQRAGLGTMAERYAHQTIITGVDVHNESALEIAHDILDGYEEVSGAHLIPNRAAAIGHALDSARPGDLVLIAGQGEQPTRFGIGESEIALTDREMCEAWFENPGSLDELFGAEDENLPVSYRIEDYR